VSEVLTASVILVIPLAPLAARLFKRSATSIPIDRVVA
jgi:hypothetical protein